LNEFKNRILQGDSLEVLQDLPDGFVNTCVTSPPYWGLRDYGVDGQLGAEPSPEEYIERMVAIFREVRRVLRDDGTLWLNLGDSYVGTGHKGQHRDPKYAQGRNGQARALNNKVDGLKPKNLVGIPWRVAFALQADGWYLRSDIIWHKPNAMPESVKDRPTKAHEYIFLLTKKPRYYYDADAIREPHVQKDRRGSRRVTYEIKAKGEQHAPSKSAGYLGQNPKGRNKRTVWTVPTRPYKGAHFAVFPPDLIEPCILAGAPEGGIVLDPFFGSGTTGLVARKHGRHYLGIELNREYIELARKRIKSELGAKECEGERFSERI